MTPWVHRARCRWTRADGSSFTGLAPGTYTVTVSLSGFGAVTVAGVAVGTDLVELPAITLRLATFEEAVVVTATRIEEPLQRNPCKESVQYST